MSTRAYPRLHRLPVATTLDVPTPPAELLPDTFAARLYGMLAPLAQHDDAAGWSLLILCNAIGLQYQLVEDWVRDTPAGPGWSLLVDLNRCPPEALPWLAQFVGVRVLPGSSAADQRARIASTDGFRRGTRNALIGAAKATLTGSQSVMFRERDHDPADAPAYAYYLTVITYVHETPDPAATLQALMAQKPGGIVLTYQSAVGQDYQQLKTDHASYTAVATAYADYTSVRIDEPVIP